MKAMVGTNPAEIKISHKDAAIITCCKDLTVCVCAYTPVDKTLRTGPKYMLENQYMGNVSL